MLQFCVLLILALQKVQCRPTDAEAKSSVSNQLHLIVANTSSSNNYHLTPLFTEIEDFEDEITKDLSAIVPFLHFLLDTSSDSEEDEDEDIDNDQMVIQLVPDFIQSKKSENPIEHESGSEKVKKDSSEEDCDKKSEKKEKESDEGSDEDADDVKSEIEPKESSEEENSNDENKSKEPKENLTKPEKKEDIPKTQ